MGAIVLPTPLEHVWTPARSPRQRAKVHVVVVHRWASPKASLDGIVDFFSDPKNQASAHGVYKGEKGKDAGRCVQMVPLDDKAWACAGFNAVSDNWEFGDDMWLGKDPEGLKVAARIVAWNCWKRRLPPTWIRGKTLLEGKGFCRHADLGRVGGGHSDPTTNQKQWLKFVYMVKHEYERGKFRANYLLFKEV